jgi:hypothetical protein
MKRIASSAFAFVFLVGTLGLGLAWGQASVDESLETASVYVDGTTGNDSNPGTQQLPLKTIGAAATMAVDNNYAGIGTKVIINPDTYRETVTLYGNSQNTTLPITFEAATTGTVTMSGADVWTGWTSYSGNPSIYTNSWPNQWGYCSADTGGSPYEQGIVLRREMIMVNGTSLTQVNSVSEMLPGTFFVDETGATIYIWPPIGTKISQATVEVATRPNLFVAQTFSNLVLRGMTFQYANSCRTDSAVKIYSGSSNILIDTDNFLWNNAQGLGFQNQASYFTVQDSVANHNGQTGMGAYLSTYSLWTNNQTSYNNWRGAQGAYYNWSSSGYHPFSLHNATVEGLTTSYNQTFGIHWDTDNNTITADSVISSENLLSAAFSEKNEGPLTISNSYLCNGNPATGLNAMGFESRNSEFITLTGDVIANNVDQIQVVGVAGGILVTNWETGEVYNLITQNFTNSGNVIEGGNGQQLFVDGQLGGTDWTDFQTTLISDNNTWWDASNTKAFTVPTPSIWTKEDYTTWLSTTGQDQNSVFAAPNGDPTGPCQLTPDATDYWLTLPILNGISTGVQAVSSGGAAVFTPTVVPLGFSGKVTLSADGVQNIPGATSSWSATSINTAGSANFTVTTSSSTPSGVYPVTIIANNGSLTKALNVTLLVNTAAAVTPTALNFSDQNLGDSSSPETVTLFNAGTTSLNVSSILAAGDYTQTNTCGTSLAAGASCAVTVTFTPTKIGTRVGTVTIKDATPLSPQKISLLGTGIGVPAVSLSSKVVQFHNQVYNTTSAPQTVTLTNTGTGTLNITSITTTGTNPGDFAQTNTCGTTVAAGKSCTFTITFTPTYTGGRNATVSIVDDATPATQTIYVTGNGTTGVSVTPKSADFGTHQVGKTSSSKTITVQNLGNTLTIYSITIGGANPGDFAKTSTCGSTLAAGASCTISVTFTATQVGSRNATLTVNDSDPLSPQTVTLTGTGD